MAKIPIWDHPENGQEPVQPAAAETEKEGESVAAANARDQEQTVPSVTNLKPLLQLISGSMNSIRQVAIQLPEGLQRLQLHLFANGLVGWSPQAEDMETAHPGVDTTADQSTQTVSPQVNLRRALDHLDVNASEDDQADDGQESDHFADVDSEASSESNERSSQQQSHGMTDEEQIAAVQAFIVGDDTLNPSLQEAAWMAATQLVSSLADASEYLEPEVIDMLSELQVRLHTIEGGLQLKIGQGIMARSIYIYGDDEASEADDEQFYHDTEEDEDIVRGVDTFSSSAFISAVNGNV
ncbi:hypothetical protein WJX77_010115 [Trebouxia sp. C0004]